jgi:tetratricopeptide (TPR) repeat protein/CHAT domain-containing protein
MRARMDHPRSPSAHGAGLAAALCWLLLLGSAAPSAGASAAATDTAAAAPAEAPAGVPDFEARKQHIKDVLRKADYKEAESLAGALLAEAETAFGKDAVEVAPVLDLLVQIRFESGRATEAESLDLAQRAVRLRESAQGKDDVGLAASLANLASVSYYRGDVAQAIALTQRALELRERALGPEAPQVVASMANLGSFFWITGDFDRARSTLERAVEIQERNPKGDRSHLAAMQGNLASLCAEMGDFARARELHERSLALTEETLGPDHPAVAVALTTLASTLQDTGDDEAARPLLERALRIQEKALGPSQFDLAPTLDGLGRLSFRAGDYAQARAWFERALAAMRPADGGPIHPNASVVLEGLGGVSLQLGDYARAQDEYAQSLQIVEKLSGPDHPRVSTSLRHLAWVKIKMGDLEGARPLVERAARIAEAGAETSLPQYAVALSNLGDLRRALGDDDAALDLISKSLEVQRRATGEESPSMALRYGSLGDLYRDRGDDAKARENYERCVALLEKTLSPDHPTHAVALGSLALAMAKTGEPGPALATALRAAAIGREHVRLTARALSEGEALRYAATQASSLDLVLTLLAHGSDVPDTTVDRVWEELALARGLVLDEMGARNRAAHALSDPAAERLRGEYVAARRHLANLLVREVGGSGGSAALRFAHGEVDRAEQALLAASTEFRAQQARERAGLADLLAGLPEGTALVSYAAYHDLLDGAAEKRPAAGRGRVVAPTRYVAFVREAGGPSFHLVPLGDGAAIDALTSAVRRELPAPGLRVDEQAYRAAGEKLRRRIWDPVAPRLAGSARAFIVADGSLQLIDFGALPAEGSTAYLIERPLLLHLLSSERDLLAGVSAPASGGLLAMGDPDFGAAAGASRVTTRAGASVVAKGGGPFRGSRSDCPGFESLRWQRLPQTAREVDEVVQIWSARGAGRSGTSPTVSKLTGPRASEAAFKQQAPGRRVLHLATHGFFLAEDCTAPTPPAAADESGPRENPLHLSGLVLAGANRRAAAGPDEEDDVVTAEEIAALDLGATEWAVLSGCDTGVGAIQAGEGVFGLRRAFRVAGARTVVMSLRPVQDLLARSWMKSLYEARFAKGLDTAAAARAASLEELRRRRAAGQSTHPAFWAAFIAAGDWR